MHSKSFKTEKGICIPLKGTQVSSGILVGNHYLRAFSGAKLSSYFLHLILGMVNVPCACSHLHQLPSLIQMQAKGHMKSTKYAMKIIQSCTYNQTLHCINYISFYILLQSCLVPILQIKQ